MPHMKNIFSDLRCIAFCCINIYICRSMYNYKKETIKNLLMTAHLFAKDNHLMKLNESRQIHFLFTKHLNLLKHLNPSGIIF